jgi:hypothetical protein
MVFPISFFGFSFFVSLLAGAWEPFVQAVSSVSSFR